MAITQFEFVVDNPGGIVEVEIDTEMLLSWAKAEWSLHEDVTASSVHEYLSADNIVMFLRNTGSLRDAEFTPTDSHWTEGTFWGLEKSD